MKELLNFSCFLFLLIGACTCQLGPLTPEYMDQLEERCTNATGDPNYLEKVSEQLSQTSCFDAALNTTNIMAEIDEMSALGRVNEVFNRTCRKQDAIMQCFHSDSRNMLNVCLTPEEIATMASHLKIFESAMRYVCQRDGELITNFFRKSGRECFNDMKLEIFHCIQPIIQKSGRTFSSAINCRDLTYLQKCMIPELRKCDQQIPAKFINGLLNAVMNELSCNIRENDINYQNSEYNNEV